MILGNFLNCSIFLLIFINKINSSCIARTYYIETATPNDAFGMALIFLMNVTSSTLLLSAEDRNPPRWCRQCQRWVWCGCR